MVEQRLPQNLWWQEYETSMSERIRLRKVKFVVLALQPLSRTEKYKITKISPNEDLFCPLPDD